MFDPLRIAAFRCPNEVYQEINNTIFHDVDKFIDYAKRKKWMEIIQLIYEGLCVPEEIVIPEDKQLVEYSDSALITYYIGEECNLACKYCYVRDQYSYKKDECDDAWLETLVDSLFVVRKRYSHITLSLSNGGEPFLYKNRLKLLINKIKENPWQFESIRLGVVTNGVIYDESVIDLLEEVDYSLVISLDGDQYHQDIHRKMINGLSIYDAVRHNMSKFLGYKNGKLNIWTISIVTNEWKSIKDSLFSLSQLGIKTAQFRIVRDRKNILGINNQTISHFLSLYQELFVFLYESIEKGNISYIQMLLNNGDFLGQILIQLLLGEPKIKRCNAFISTLSIDKDGTFRPCAYFNGDIEYRLSNEETSNIPKKMINEFLLEDVFHTSECSDCWCRMLCGGKCVYQKAYEKDIDRNAYCSLVRYLVMHAIDLVDHLEETDEHLYETLYKYAYIRRRMEVVTE